MYRRGLDLVAISNTNFYIGSLMALMAGKNTNRGGVRAWYVRIDNTGAISAISNTMSTYGNLLWQAAKCNFWGMRIYERNRG